MRVCQYRHDGNLDCNAAAAARPPSQEDQHFYFTGLSQPVKPRLPRPEADSRRPSYPSFAVIEIFAFSTFDTGHPFSAASAYF
jgi:hypothetical protein